MAKETKRLCHHIAHTSATASWENVSYSGILCFALCATITISQGFLRAQLGTFPSTCPCASHVCQGKDEAPVWDQEGQDQQGKVTLQW